MKMEIRGLEKLSFRERQVVALKETGHGNEEVASRLGIGTSTVATLLSRARSKGYQVVLVVEGDPLDIFGEPGGEEEVE
ncbi:MAG: sigma factor-like helix-turn-helix DNA-binding protein [Bacillota bacterium]